MLSHYELLQSLRRRSPAFRELSVTLPNRLTQHDQADRVTKVGLRVQPVDTTSIPTLFRYLKQSTTVLARLNTLTGTPSIECVSTP